jgi:hypothetical protein
MTDHDRLHPLRPLLKNWVWERGRIGTRYLDCVDGEIKFDEGKKSRFAAEECVYVPLDKNAEDDASADGPAIQETRLARFLRAAQLGKPAEAGSMAEVQLAVQDCIEIGLVSAYQLDAREAFACYAREPMFEDEIRAAVATDIRRIYAGMREQLALYDFSVLYDLPMPLLISETPFIDWRVHASPALPFVSLPLGPYCLLVGAPSGRSSRIGPVVWKAATAMGPFKDHNRQIAEHARLWLVATTDDQLIAVKSRLSAARVQSESM